MSERKVKFNFQGLAKKTGSTMIVKRFKIPIYDYNVTLVEAESKEDVSKIEIILKRETINKEDVNEIIQELTEGKFNGAYTYRNMRYRTFTVFLFPMKSKLKRLNILGHEKRHIEDRIAEHNSINDIETMGYLAGFLTEKLFT